jgi:hypothetical protein
MEPNKATNSPGTEEIGSTILEGAFIRPGTDDIVTTEKKKLFAVD